MFGMALGLVVLSTVFMGCKNPSGGGTDPGIVRPNVINGYYGVTADGKTIEVIVTPSSSSNVLSNTNVSRSVTYTVSNAYVIKIDGIVVSSGTVDNTGGTITFTPTDGSIINSSPSSGGVLTSISVTSSGVTYSASMHEAIDFYYAIGAATTYTLAECKALMAGKTPEEVYAYCWSAGETFFDPDSDSGTFDEIVAFGRSNDCPDTEISRVSKDLNSGKISGMGSYSHVVSGITYNVMFYVSKVPLTP
jgi:hypothetical protein